jgi:NDP-sugar pyrophosphorylase family protein
MSQVNEVVPDVFILCGGQGTRFREMREDIPKALAPINGVPFLDLLLIDLVAEGCRRIILGTGYLSEQIEAHFQQRNDAEYLISREHSPLGTGGAIRNALPLFESDQVLVLNGDSYIVFSVKTLLNFHISQQAEATILLSSGTQGRDYGNVELGENYQILSFQEKTKNADARLINAGVYCLQKELVQLQPEGSTSLERDWFPQWIYNNRVLGMVLPNPFYDIGTRERFELAKQKIKKRKY